MKRVLFIGLFLILIVSTGYSKISIESYDKFCKGIDFGMDLNTFLQVMKDRIRSNYQLKISSTTDASLKDSLRLQMQRDIKKVDSWVVNLTPDKKAWMASILKDEFIPGNKEILVVVPLQKQKRYFLFHNHKLAKIIQIKPKPISKYLFHFTEIYGKPAHIKYQFNGSNKPVKIIWEDGSIRFVMKDMGSLYNSVMFSWADQKEDDRWLALKKKYDMENKRNTNSIINNMDSTKEDSNVDKEIDSILGTGGEKFTPKLTPPELPKK